MSKLQEKRKEQGLTQAELAAKSKVNIRMIQHYEQGFKDISKAQVSIVLALAKALGCGVEDII